MLQKKSANLVSVDCMIIQCIYHAAPLCSREALVEKQKLSYFDNTMRGNVGMENKLNARHDRRQEEKRTPTN